MIKECKNKIIITLFISSLLLTSIYIFNNSDEELSDEELKENMILNVDKLHITTINVYYSSELEKYFYIDENNTIKYINKKWI